MALPRFTTLACSAALLLCGAAQAAGNKSGDMHHSRSHWQQQRAACANLPEASRAPCMREMGAAAQAARTGDLTSPGENTYERNAMARCEVFKTQQDQSDCRARLSGQPVSGSVQGGGVLREATTMVPAPRQ
ncbi:hypothetical protein SAMN05428957_1143 [Oryzisolibacter propanilivorax]|uniref:PsiF repeat-containing protein n=1 Tax=Oryzisolibacter propanilivorax TaxID=1527607 RepID=A0A1G9VNV7_9BURK|nr:hypothetical protein [Oryzisolibacter propanilivorax]SDM73800.1 hypothetical protein SAMN05428957_1143 [Oryzisolibacter propanilivorax]